MSIVQLVEPKSEDKMSDTLTEIEKPRVVYANQAWEKIKYWVKEKSHEVSGFGPVEILEDGRMHVMDALLAEQSGSSGSTDLTPRGFSDILHRLKDVDYALLLWWHSHPTFNVFMSSTDKTTIKELGVDGPVLASCFNQKGEVFTAFYSKDALVFPWGEKKDLYLDELETRYFLPPTPKEWKEEMDKYVKAKTYPTTKWKGKGSRSYTSWTGVTSERKKRKDGKTCGWHPREGEAKEGQDPYLYSTQVWYFSNRFSDEELAVLDEVRWCDHDLDLLFDEGLRVKEIMAWIKNGWDDPEKIIEAVTATRDLQEEVTGKVQ